jgi:hypothetical protein
MFFGPAAPGLGQIGGARVPLEVDLGMGPMNLWRALRSAVLAVLVVALAAGCASIGLGRTPEDVVRERAQARWNALVERDWKTAYPFLIPAYREIVPLKRYGNQFTGPMQWEGAKVHDAKCEETRCTVIVEVTFRLLLKGHTDRVSSTFMDEVWVLEDGQWYKFEAL